MNREQFQDRVSRFQAMAASRPLQYRAQAMSFLVLGYSIYVAALVLVAATLVSAGLLAFATHAWWSWALFVVLAVCAGAALKVVWVRTAPPEGLAISVRHAPRLLAELRELSQRLRAPAIHRVVLTAKFEVEMIQMPRIGIFGGFRNWLRIGYPVIASLPPELFRALLAHHIGRAAGYDNPFGARLCRVQRAWGIVMEGMEAQLCKQGASRALLRLTARGWMVLFRWFVPRLQAHTSNLAEQSVFAGDRAAADVVGNDLTARTVAECAVRGQIAQPFMNGDAHTGDSCSRLHAALGRGIDPIEAAQLLRQAFAEEVAAPTTNERLQALDFATADALFLVRRLHLGHEFAYSAAQHHLGQSLPWVHAQLEQRSALRESTAQAAAGA